MALKTGNRAGAAMLRGRRLALLLVAGLGFPVDRLLAAQLNYEVGYRAEYSDNVTRLENESDKTLINTVSAQLLFVEDSSAITARILAGATHFYYDKEYFRHGTDVYTYDAQNQYLLDAYGEVFFLERSMSWVAADGYRQVLGNSLDPDVPENRVNTNVWATGPNLFLRLSPVDTVRLEGRIGRSWIEGEEFDNRRWSYAARWLRRSSEFGIWSLNAEKLEIKFDEVLRDDIANVIQNPDISRYNYFYRYNLRNSRTQFSVDLGRTRIEQAEAMPVSDWLARVSLAALVGTISTVGFQYRREFADTGGELLPAAPTQPLPGAGSGAPPLGVDVVSGEPYYLRQVHAFYSRRSDSLPWMIRAFYRDVSYQTLPDDRLERGVAVGINYHYSGTITLEISGIYSVQENNLLVQRDPVPAPPLSPTRLLNQKYRDSNVGVGLRYRLTPNLHAVLDFRRYSRRSSSDLNPDDTALDEIGEADNGSYTDDRVGLALRYTSAPAGR